MAYNPSPKVADARALATKYGKSRVIVLMVDDEAGTLEYASFGQTPRLCEKTRRLADVAYEAVLHAFETGVGR